MALNSMLFPYPKLYKRETKSQEGCFLISTEFFFLVCIIFSRDPELDCTKFEFSF